MKKLSNLIKMLMIHTLVFSLMQNPFVNDALAAEKKSKGGFEAKEILNLANGALGIYGNYLGQKQQMIQQQIAAANNQKLMAQLGPTCRKPDGTACYTTPGKYFPECTLPASMSNMPKNVCSNSTPEVGQISSMITYEAIANGWSNYYEQMSNKASNSSYPVGLRCLEDKQKALDSQLIEMSNSLQRLQDRLNQDKQVFRDNNKRLLEDMNTANDELFGANKNNLKTRTQDFAKLFSQSCQSVIGKDALKSGTAGGLNGILQGMSSNNKAAADFSLNKSVIETDVRREADKIAALINAGGIDDWLNNPKTASDVKSSNFPSIESTTNKQAAEFRTARARINKELAALGYTPPPMDKNFTADMDEFMAQSTDFFKKKYVSDCVTGADKGIAIPVDDILKNLEQKRTGSTGTATIDYRVALKKILDSDAMMDKKMEMIKALEPQYPGITITYKDASQSRVTDSPYNLFMKTIDKCELRYSQDDQFSSKGSTGVSYQKKVERGRTALQELKNLNDSFASKVTQSITNQVLNCNGEQSKSGNDCSEDTMKTTAPNFCVAHASQCANEIQGCYAEANTHVLMRKTKMENLAKTFNANVAAMVARSNALYEQQKVAVTNITKLIQSKFPGTNFELPKDMFVSMPELKKDAFGVEMAGDGDLKSFLEGETSMPAKIDKLKEMFKKQREKVKEEVGSYIALQENAMREQKSKWESLADECKGAIDSSSKAIAQMNNENAKKQAEEDAKVGKFCKKYNSISQNPVGGCGKAKDLAELSDAIASRLTSQATSLTEQYASACDGFNNKNDDLPSYCSLSSNAQDDDQKIICANKRKELARSSSPSDSKSKKDFPLRKLCGSENSDKDFLANAAKKLSKDDQKKIEDLTTLDSIIAKVNDMEDGGFFTDIKKMVPNGKDICKQLNDIESASDAPITADDEKAKIADQDKIINAATEELKLPAVAQPTGTPATEIQITEFNKKQTEYQNNKAKREAAQEKIKKATELKTKLSSEKVDKLASVEKKKKLQASLNDLASSAAPLDPTEKDGQAVFISKIGEQMEGPCDMQSNTGLAKNGPSMTDFLRENDASVLGISK